MVLEQSAEAVGSWPRFYDSLRLFSPARFSGLPRRSFPGNDAHYPPRDEVVEYLRSYGSGLDVDIRTGHRVQTVTALLGEGFRITTTSGVGIAADTVIAATGGFGHPHVPAVPGMAGFAGRIMHAADYRAGNVVTVPAELSTIMPPASDPATKAGPAGPRGSVSSTKHSNAPLPVTDLVAIDHRGRRREVYLSS